MRTVEILIVEDSSADLFWLEYVLKSLSVDCSLSSVADGESAVDFLLKRGKHAEAPTPDLIFLDVNLPMLSGLEVLRQVPDAHNLPVCVLTSSEGDRKLFQREFDIQNSNYLLKPVSQENLLASSCCRDHLNLDARGTTI